MATFPHSLQVTPSPFLYPPKKMAHIKTVSHAHLHTDTARVIGIQEVEQATCLWITTSQHPTEVMVFHRFPTPL